MMDETDPGEDDDGHKTYATLTPVEFHQHDYPAENTALDNPLMIQDNSNPCSSSSNGNNVGGKTPFVRIDPNVCWTGNTDEGVLFTLEPVICATPIRVEVPKEHLYNTSYNPLDPAAQPDDPPQSTNDRKRKRPVVPELSKLSKKTCYERECLDLRCEWELCQHVFQDMKKFMTHVSSHVQEVCMYVCM